MNKIKVCLSKEQLSQKMVELSHGKGGLIVIPVDYWKMVTDAYDSPLLRRIAEVAISVRPITMVKNEELKFEVEVKPE